MNHYRLTFLDRDGNPMSRRYVMADTEEQAYQASYPFRPWKAASVDVDRCHPMAAEMITKLV